MNYDIKSMTASEIEAVLKQLGQPSYRAKQIYSWLHKNKASSYSEMTGGVVSS